MIQETIRSQTMYGYIYETTNIVNGMKYIGKHKATTFEGTKYLGSGKALRNAIKKYGRENFIVKLIEECNTETELIEREIYYINQRNAVKDRNYYNIIYDSSGGDVIQFLPFERQQQIHKDHSIMMQSFRHSEESKQLMSRQRKGHPVSAETKQRISLSNMGKRKGRTETAETKQKHSIARLGYKMDSETKQKISQSNKGKRLGIKASAETIAKLKESHRGLRWMSNQFETIRVPEQECKTYLAMGYKMQRHLIV